MTAGSWELLNLSVRKRVQRAHTEGNLQRGTFRGSEIGQSGATREYPTEDCISGGVSSEKRESRQKNKKRREPKGQNLQGSKRRGPSETWAAAVKIQRKNPP